MHEVHFKSQSGEWGTPQHLFDDLDEIFHFDLDVCATKSNAKCMRYFTKEDNALDPTNRWETSCWMNPPYGREIRDWIIRARLAEQVNKNSLVVCLIPARTDTRWWQANVGSASAVVFIRELDFELPSKFYTYPIPGDINSIFQPISEADNTPRGMITQASAPFPSALMIFGKLSEQEILELKELDLGWSIIQRIDRRWL